MAGTYYATTTEEDSTTIAGVQVNNTDQLVKLVPKSEGKIIDVVSNFAWSASPRLQESLKKVPVMYLQEREQVQNSLISSALYYLNAMKAFDVGEKNIGENLITKLDTLVKDFALGTTELLGRAFNQEYFKKLQDLILNTQHDDESLLNDKLKSYIGIYLTKPTGFNYVLPFFNETPLGINSSWSSESQILNNPIAGAIDAAQGAMERTAYMLNITQPGTFIEKPKYYQYETIGDTVTVSFPLFNTIKKTDKLSYQQNYELLWILAFQNKPYRTSFSRISPPKLYTLTVPGQKYMPYCYISNMDIKFGGTRRNMPVSIPLPNPVEGQGPAQFDSSTVEVSVPDVYMVSITFTSLLADVANTLVDSGFTSKKISIGTVASSRASTTAPVVTAPVVTTNSSVAPSPPNAELIAADRERAAFASRASTNTDELFRRQRDLERARRLIDDFTTLPSVNTAQRFNNSQPSRRRVEFVTRD